MHATVPVSPALQGLLKHAEELLGTEILLRRLPDAPDGGLLLDPYSYDCSHPIIVSPARQLGLLKDVAIAENCILLLMKGAAHARGEYRVLSFDAGSVQRGMEQIYLDTLKDTQTRSLGIARKKKLIFYLYMLFFEALTEIPLRILANIYMARLLEPMRNAHVYRLLKESSRDMHELVAFRDLLPMRYFVLHNAIYYARDIALAETAAVYDLHPLIHVPELRRFKNLEVKEMMTHRWNRSPWYHTKLVGDRLRQELAPALEFDCAVAKTRDFYGDLFNLSTRIADRWILRMSMQGWYSWESSGHLRDAIACQDTIERQAADAVFGEI